MKVITKEEKHSEHQLYLYSVISLFTSLFFLSYIIQLIILRLQPKKGGRVQLTVIVTTVVVIVTKFSHIRK